MWYSSQRANKQTKDTRPAISVNPYIFGCTYSYKSMTPPLKASPIELLRPELRAYSYSCCILSPAAQLNDLNISGHFLILFLLYKILIAKLVIQKSGIYKKCWLRQEKGRVWMEKWIRVIYGVV